MKHVLLLCLISLSSSQVFASASGYGIITELTTQHVNIEAGTIANIDSAAKIQKYPFTGYDQKRTLAFFKMENSTFVTAVTGLAGSIIPGHRYTWNSVTGSTTAKFFDPRGGRLFASLTNLSQVTSSAYSPLSCNLQLRYAKVDDLNLTTEYGHTSAIYYTVSSTDDNAPDTTSSSQGNTTTFNGFVTRPSAGNYTWVYGILSASVYGGTGGTGAWQWTAQADGVKLDSLCHATLVSTGLARAHELVARN
jgi:hypothetical protein